MKWATTPSAFGPAPACNPASRLRTASTEAVRSLVAAGLGVSIQPDMTYRPWSLEGDIIEARPIADLSQTLDVGLAWRRGTARPGAGRPFPHRCPGTARTHASHLFNRMLHSVS